MGSSVLIKDLAKRMITLSGKNDSEIKIEFTGLRKGEKYLKNFFNEEKLIKLKLKEFYLLTISCIRLMLVAAENFYP